MRQDVGKRTSLDLGESNKLKYCETEKAEDSNEKDMVDIDSNSMQTETETDAGDCEFISFSTIGHEELWFDDFVDALESKSRSPRKIASRHMAAMGGGGDLAPIIDIPQSPQRAYSSSFSFNDPNVAFMDSAANKHLLRSLKKLQHIREG